MSEANNHQVGGKHYKSIKIPDHWDVAYVLGWDYFVAAATKYLWRLGRKHPGKAGQLQDLEKAIHYLQKKRELLIAEIEDENRAAMFSDIQEREILEATIKKKLLDQLAYEEGAPEPKGYVDQDR